MGRKKWESYLIDGYNVINSWPELKKITADLATARDTLTHILAEYGAFEKYDITIVFDAMFTDDDEHAEQINPHLLIIYTGAGETADSCIERLSYDLVRRGKEVHVVTSDGAEQSVILGAGAYRIPSLEFRKMVRRTKQQLTKEFVGHTSPTVARLDVQERLDAATVDKLDQLRKQRN